jgi:hypothetical protein
MPVIPGLGKWSLEDHEFKASLWYIVRPCPKQNKTQHKIKQNPTLHWVTKVLFSS